MPTPIETYIFEQDPLVQPALLRMREIILESAPGCKERLAWGMPTFTGNKNLVHFCANKHHVGFYPGSDAIEAFQEKLAAFKTTKGGIQLPYDKELPAQLVAEITRYCVAQDSRG